MLMLPAFPFQFTFLDVYGGGAFLDVGLHGGGYLERVYSAVELAVPAELESSEELHEFCEVEVVVFFKQECREFGQL